MAASLETNKALAALLTAGIIASGSGVISRIIYHPSMPEENAYVIEVTEGEKAGGEAAAEAEAAPLPALLAAASPEAGQSEAKKCAACHNFEEGAGAKIGPDLYGVVGRPIASAEGFSYSDALKEKQGDWTYDNLNAFLTDPKKWAPGTKMTFAGIKSPEGRADVLVYLRTLAATPAPLPEVAAAETPPGAASTEESTAAASPAEAPAEARQPQAGQGEQVAAATTGGFASLVAGADPAAGEKVAKKCAVCHNFEEGAGSKIGPDLYNVVGRPIASVEDFSYSDGLKEKQGDWNYEELNAFLTDPRKWAPGTKMAFAGLKKEEERAEVVAYLRSISENPPPLPGSGG